MPNISDSMDLADVTLGHYNDGRARSWSLKDLADTVLDKSLSKQVRDDDPDWEDHELSPMLQHYAALDAVASLGVHEALLREKASAAEHTALIQSAIGNAVDSQEVSDLGVANLDQGLMHQLVGDGRDVPLGDELPDLGDSDNDSDADADEESIGPADDSLVDDLMQPAVSNSKQKSTSTVTEEHDAKVKSDAFHILQRYGKALASTHDPWSAAFIA